MKSVTYLRAWTPTDCTQQDCSGCEHLLSNTNKGVEVEDGARGVRRRRVEWWRGGERNCMSLLIC